MRTTKKPCLSHGWCRYCHHGSCHCSCCFVALLRRHKGLTGQKAEGHKGSGGQKSLGERRGTSHGQISSDSTRYWGCSALSLEEKACVPFFASHGCSSIGKPCRYPIDMRHRIACQIQTYSNFYKHIWQGQGANFYEMFASRSSLGPLLQLQLHGLHVAMLRFRNLQGCTTWNRNNIREDTSVTTKHRNIYYIYILLDIR